MSENPYARHVPEWPEEAQRRRRRRRLWQAAAATAVAGGIVAGTVSLAGAQTSAPQPTASPVCTVAGHDSDASLGDWPGAAWADGVPWADGTPWAQAGIGTVLHGQAIATSGGGTQTVLVQRGDVTSATRSSIALKSSDGFTATYQVTSSTKVICGDGAVGSITSGTEVFLVATQDGGQPVANEIIKVGDNSSNS